MFMPVYLVTIGDTVCPAKQRALTPGLVAIGTTIRPNAHAQGPGYHDPPRSLDDMEAPQRLRLQRSAPIGERPANEDKEEASLWASAGALGLRAITPRHGMSINSKAVSAS
ncbi:hypothetical protein VPH35_116778 [Triticum aestivum]